MATRQRSAAPPAPARSTAPPATPRHADRRRSWTGSPGHRANPPEAVPCAATRQKQCTSPQSPAAPEPNEHLQDVLRSLVCHLGLDAESAERAGKNPSQRSRGSRGTQRSCASRLLGDLRDWFSSAGSDHLFTSIVVVAVRPNTSGSYISSARAGAVRNVPAVVARTM